MEKAAGAAKPAGCGQRTRNPPGGGICIGDSPVPESPRAVVGARHWRSKLARIGIRVTHGPAEGTGTTHPRALVAFGPQSGKPWSRGGEGIPPPADAGRGP